MTPTLRLARSIPSAFPLALARFLALILAWAAAPPAQAQIGFGPSITATPGSASAGGTVSISAARLTGTHSYSVDLLPSGGTPVVLFSLSSSADSFHRDVTLPALPVAKYTLELRADGSVIDTASFGLVNSLPLALTPTSAAAGTFVQFSVSGLVAGSLVLDYDGVPAYGPVSVAGGSLTGKFRLPTDHPALPASVRVTARNRVGKQTPRVGETTLSVRPPNTSPFVSLVNATPSTRQPQRGTPFGISGQLTFNEAQADEVSVSQFWQAPDGSLAPMGASQFSVSPGGQFQSSQRVPQFGTMSAFAAAGSGQAITVTRVIDANGVPQFQSSGLGALTTVLDTDSDVDLTVVLHGSDGTALNGARLDLDTQQAEELFGSSNSGGVYLDGSPTRTPTQYDPNPQSVLEGCPTTPQRQFSNAQGRASFTFGVDPPQGGYFLDGSSVHLATIVPSETCVGPVDINTPGFCTYADPAGLAFTVFVRTAHLGYGYRDAQNAELPVTIAARVDKYTGQIATTTCAPNQACQTASFQRSANLSLVLPKLAGPSLQVGEPFLRENSGIDRGIGADSPAESAGAYQFRHIANLSRLKGAATFAPPIPRALRFSYTPGGGQPLREAHLLLQRATGSGFEPVGDFVRETGPASCDTPDGAEVWAFPLAGNLSTILRFPHDRWPAANGDFRACGYIYGQDQLGTGFVRKFCLNWSRLPDAVDALTDRHVDEVYAPYAAEISGHVDNPSGATHSPASDPDYHVDAKDNSLVSAAEVTLCTPETDPNYCRPGASFLQQHEQFSREPSLQPQQFSDGQGQVHLPGPGESLDWQTLFDTTVPLFRYYWGVPELLSAEVFADLGLRALSLLQIDFDPAHPEQSQQKIGGALSVSITIGVDIDVLFGVLVDAGASITGAALSAIVAHVPPDQGDGVDECFRFLMWFDGWLEIGCPIPNPFDPSCYIPDIQEHFNIVDSGNSCGVPDAQDGLHGALSALRSQADPRALTPEQRRALYRHPAIAFDSDGNGLALWLDDQGRLVSRGMLGRSLGAGPADVISTGWGIRDVAVAFLGPRRAVAVWAENALSDDVFRHADLPARARNQHLRYATWDGSRWSAPADLTAPGKGEGQVRLARCAGSTVDCPRNGRVTAVWQRNTAGDLYHATMHIWTSDFGGSSWTTPVQVDKTGTLNITPALAYQGGKPVVGWVRHDPGATLSDTDRRHFAYRRLDGSSLEHVDTQLPAGIAAPDLGSDGSTLALTFTRADTGYGFIGTRQAVYLANADCSAGLCQFDHWALRDEHGRGLYGERPRVLIDAQARAIVTFRGLGYGAAAGETTIRYPDDLPGLVNASGDLVQLRTPLSEQPATLIALSRDGATHFQPTVALDPGSDDTVALSVNLPNAVSEALALQPTRLEARRPAAASLASVDAGVELAATDLAPDLAVESISVSLSRLVPGGTVPVRVILANRGSDWLPDADARARLSVWWDHPTTRTTAPVGVDVTALDGNARRSLLLQLPVPTDFHDDERQTVRASLVLTAAAREMDGANNELAHSIGGLPAVAHARVVLAPGRRVTHLAWDPSGDARVKGYRIYVEDEPGRLRPLGSSFAAGFVDMTAQFGRARRYYVSTYSARGVESERVGPLIAAPQPPDDVLFADGFDG